MIISRNICNKNFDINSDLIPEKGRLVQCSSCNNKWFFQKNATVSNDKRNIEITYSDKFDITQIKKNIPENNIQKISEIEDLPIPKDTEKLITQAETSLNNKKKIIKKNNILNYTLIFILTFTSFIILIDTFKYPISKIIPNIEFILYNLYETIKDMRLFFKDLI